jgi:predicted transposase YbfD/YdcC
MKTIIPSPIPFLTQLPDSRNSERITHHQTTFWQLTMTALLAGCGNILEMTQWLDDQRDLLIEHLEIRTVNGESSLPSQASLYRFLWRVESQLEAFEQLLLSWLRVVLKTVDFKQQWIGINLDGKYLLGSKRVRKAEGSFVMMGAFISVLGVMLTQSTVQSTETQTAKALLPTLKSLFSTGQWVVTMDAGVTEQDFAKRIVKAGGHYLMQVKRNQPEAWQMLHWTFHYPIAETGDWFVESEHRSGEIWSWHVETCNALPEGLRTAFPSAVLAVRLQREVLRCHTGEIRRETVFALTSTTASAAELYELWRGHWGIENRSHHKRDTVFGEDACRTRKAGRTLAGLRNALLSLLHLEKVPVLRSVRRFSNHPLEALRFLGLAS